MKPVIVRISIIYIVASLAFLAGGCGRATSPPTPTPKVATLFPTETPSSLIPPPASPTATVEATSTLPSPTATPAAPTVTPQPTPVPTPLVALPPPVQPLTQTLAGPITVDSATSVTEIGRWGGGSVSDITYSPDGTQVALVTSLGLELHDTQTLARLPFLAPEPGWSFAALSPDWQTVAWVSGPLIRLQRVSDGQPLMTLEGQPGTERRVAFSPDGSLLASMSFPLGEEVYTANLELWQLSDGALLGTWASGGSDLTWSPDGKLLATWYAMTGVNVWSVPGGAQVHLVESGALDAAFSPDGKSLAVAGFSAPVQLWRVSDWTQLWQIEALSTQIRFSSDGSLVAFSESSGTAQLVRASDGQAIRSVGYGLADYAPPLAFSPDGQVFSLGSTMDVQSWRVADGTLLQVLEGHSFGVSSTAVSSDGRTVAFMTRSPSSPGAALRLWDLSGASAPPLPGSSDALSFAWSPDGQTAALGMWDGSVRLVQVPGGQETRTLGRFGTQVHSVAFPPQGDLVAATAMAEVRLWRAGDGALLYKWPGAGWMDSATFSPDGSLLAAHAAGGVGAVRVWRVDTGEVVQRLATEVGYSDHLAFLPDGTALAVEQPGEVQLWSTPEGKLLQTLEVAADAGPFAFSPDAALLALSSGDLVQLWRVSDGELLATLVGHTGWVSSVIFSPDGRFLVTGSEDGTVRLWGVPESTP